MHTRPTHNDSRTPANSRRSFFKAAALCAGLPIIGCSGQTTTAEEEEEEERPQIKVLSEGNHVALKEAPEAIIERACEFGRTYQGKYGGCAQCTVAALQDAIDFVPVDDNVFLAASCLDGGATPTAKANCGAFSGSAIVIGHLCGRTRDNFDGGSELAHRLIHQVHDGFVETFGSVLCGEVRAAVDRKCVEVVSTGARLAAQAIVNEFGEYNPEQA